MKLNKALQSTQISSTTTNTGQTVKEACEPATDVQKGDNPISRLRGITFMSVIFDKRVELSQKQGISLGTFDLLVRIGKSWELNIPSTVYSLGKRADKGDLTYIHAKIGILRSKRLIEVVGYGTHRCSAYGLTIRGESVLNELLVSMVQVA